MQGLTPFIVDSHSHLIAYNLPAYTYSRATVESLLKGESLYDDPNSVFLKAFSSDYAYLVCHSYFVEAPPTKYGHF